jgi:hypothetical protein
MTEEKEKKGFLYKLNKLKKSTSLLISEKEVSPRISNIFNLKLKTKKNENINKKNVENASINTIYENIKTEDNVMLESFINQFDDKEEINCCFCNNIPQSIKMDCLHGYCKDCYEIIEMFEGKCKICKKNFD